MTDRSIMTKKIQKRTAVTCVIGLGYVGLPEAISFAQAGYRVIGIDINRERVHQVNSGSSYIPDVDSNTLASLVGAGWLSATGDLDALRDADCVCICDFGRVGVHAVPCEPCGAERRESRLNRSEHSALNTRPSTLSREP